MKVFLVQHSHSDPGYTHPRDEVWRHQLRNIARSVEFARRDEDYRWTAECFWFIDEALRRGHPLPEGFIEAARAGRIALTATYLNGSDHLDAEDFRRMLRFARAFCDRHGIPLRSAMQCDVNGVNACMPDLLHEAGVTRMSFAINDERGGAPFRRPNAFWWRGPRGGRILVFNGFVYLRANEYGMHRGFEAFREGACKLADDLSRAGYALPVCLLQGCGTYDDNGLAAPWMAEMSRAWRDHRSQHRQRSSPLPSERGRGQSAAPPSFTGKDEDRVLAGAATFDLDFVSATIDEFFDALESCGAEFPEHAGPWPDWWSDGHTSAPLELKRAYQARRTLRAIEPLLDEKDKAIGTPFEAAQRDVWMYMEHTFGSWRSVGEPDAPDSKRQWADKSVLAHRAAEEAGFLADDLLFASTMGDGCLLCPPGCTSSQYSTYQIPREDFPESGEIIFSPNPAHARAWVIAPNEQQAMADVIVWAKPCGERMVSLKRARFEQGAFERTMTVPRDLDAAWNELPLVMIESLRGTRPQLRHADPALHIDRVEAKCVRVESVECELWHGVRCELSAPGWKTLTLTRRTWRESMTHEDILSGVKEHVEDPHACFLVWNPPLAPAEVWAESGGFWHRPGIDELPGACRDWHVVHQGVEIRCRDGTNIAFWTPDAPVIHFGDINTGKWSRDVDPQNGALAVCLYHNYWYVNFPATASGRMTYRFRVASGKGLDARATLESWNHPFLVFMDSPRAAALRERRWSRLNEPAVY